MDRQYLEDYEQRETEEFEQTVVKGIKMGNFSFETNRYPPDSRFFNLQYPVARTSLKISKIALCFTQFLIFETVVP